MKHLLRTSLVILGLCGSGMAQIAHPPLPNPNSPYPPDGTLLRHPPLPNPNSPYPPDGTLLRHPPLPNPNSPYPPDGTL